MLLQSHTQVIRVFPAIPDSWKNVSFQTLRAEGAVLISASLKEGKVHSIQITPENEGICRIQNPFEPKGYLLSGIKKAEIQEQNGILVFPIHKGKKIEMTRISS